MKILIPIPNHGFDPTETAVPWKICKQNGFEVVFSTPDGSMGTADPRMLTGAGLGPFKRLLRADENALAAYREMERSNEFLAPLPYSQLNEEDYVGIVLPGGHEKGMRTYLESQTLQALVTQFFRSSKPVGAICHGVLLAARSGIGGRSVLFGRKTTALTKFQEYTAYHLTRLWLGDYYLTYSTPVEDEVKSALASPDDFIRGPISTSRDTPEDLSCGFVVKDGNYLSARWPGDAHRFADEFVQLTQKWSPPFGG